MDPAQPAFELAGSAGRLDKGDATLVDVIHTNSGMLWEVNDTGFLTNVKQVSNECTYMFRFDRK